MKGLEVYTAEEAGFCFGVKRAIEMAKDAADDERKLSVYTLGPIIHNPQVVEKLKGLGIEPINSIDDIDEGIIIIRSHGVAPEIITKAKEKGLHILDATCPFVKKAQRYAQLLIEEDYQTIIYGDHQHPEVVGIYGATDKKAVILDNVADLARIPLKNRVGLVAQTTKSPDSFKELVSSIIIRVKELKVYNTICNTTETRQLAAAKLARKVDLMFVIGGHNSANTNRLAEICKNTGTPTFHIETVEEINQQLINGKKKIGITAGASTPDWLIKEVIEAMSEEEKKDVQLDETIEEEDNKTAAVLEEETSESVDVEVTEETGDNVEDKDQQEIDYSVNDIADLKKGQTVKGTVTQIKDDGVYVDVNYKSDGFIPLRELSHKPVSDPNEVVELNEEINVIILTLEDDEGNMILSKKRADYEKAWENIMEVYENDEVIEAKVSKVVKGGLVVDVGLRGFIPASHVAIGYVEDLNKYVDQTLRLKVIEVERNNNNVVLSAKKVLEEERAEMKEKTLDSLEEGQEIEGTITKLVDFGAFVDLGGVEGLLHISEMSWGRIEHPSQIFEEGQKIKVKVLGVNKEEERISLGYKQLLPDPWEEFVRKHYEGEVVTGTITKIVDFGAFVEIEDGVEGLIHISQLSHRHVKTPDEVVSVGEEIQVKIINISEGQKRVGLSIKELEEKPQSQKEVKPQAAAKKRETEEEGSGVTLGDIFGSMFDDDNE
ncbi:MAG: bifunctional 4-hydroxy-3-methylbut-2-enyl diphosphate reductase/30S ribosomal protein S1 [Firmicutes bacterium]|nr:bifunctional 4-hydroxy-3-methylbut-2-enyl diphosphate reductase/30S ribosomal protein S1 [Bacillota bacterium]